MYPCNRIRAIARRFRIVGSKERIKQLNKTGMIKKVLLLAVTVLVSQVLIAGPYDKIDKQATKLPSSATKTVQLLTTYLKSNFATPDEQLRAAYVWMSKNIGFDKGGDIDLTSTYEGDSVANTILKRKKGVCSDFAELFQKIGSGLGLEAYIITGYTMINGTVDTDGHAWNAIKTGDGKWLLFDPMWGAGSLSKGKFSKKQNTDYCAVEPAQFIKTHMPFDPMWQLLTHPIKAEAFYKSEDPATSTPNFNFNDTLAVHNKLFKSEQLQALCRRLSWAGDVNPATAMMLDVSQQNIVIYQKKEKYALEFRNIKAFNGVADKVNRTIEFYKKYTDSKKKLKTKSVSVLTLKTYMDSCSYNIAGAQLLLNKLNFEKEEQLKQKADLAKTIADLQKEIDKQTAFLKKQKDTLPKKKGKK